MMEKLEVGDAASTHLPHFLVWLLGCKDIKSGSSVDETYFLIIQPPETRLLLSLFRLSHFVGKLFLLILYHRSENEVYMKSLQTRPLSA